MVAVGRLLELASAEAVQDDGSDMGEGKRKRQRFLHAHPRCAYCGGARPTTTIDHCPPRAMFQHRVAPEGMEFPACDECNHGSSDDDLLVAMLARMDPFFNSGDADGRARGLIEGVNKQFPAILKEMFPSAIDARRLNRELGLEPAPGQLHQQVGVTRIPQMMQSAVQRFALKFAKATFYRGAGFPLPNEGGAALHWFTNTELVRHGTYPVFTILSKLTGESPAVTRSGKNLRDQFEYKATLSSDKALFVVQAVFGKGFGLVVIASPEPGRVEALIARAKAASGRPDDLFEILQPRK